MAKEARFQEPRRHPEKYVSEYGIPHGLRGPSQSLARRLGKQLALMVPNEGFQLVAVHSAGQARFDPPRGKAGNYPIGYVKTTT